MDIKIIQSEIEQTRIKISFYIKFIKEAELLGIAELIDFKNYLNIRG